MACSALKYTVGYEREEDYEGHFYLDRAAGHALDSNSRAVA